MLDLFYTCLHATIHGKYLTVSIVVQIGKMSLDVLNASLSQSSYSKFIVDINVGCWRQSY